MRHNINAFCSEFRGEALEESPQQTLSPPLADQDDHDQAYEASKLEKVSSFIATVISAYRTFPCKTYLKEVIDRFRTLEQTPFEGLSTPGEASLQIIGDMMEGKGVSNEMKADSVVRAFKELWPYQFENVGEGRINISTILELAKGLSAISALRIIIHESQYLGVIVSFCTMFSHSYAVNGGVAEYHGNLVKSAIRIARGSAPAPMPAPPLAQTVDGNPGVALLEALIRDHDAYEEHCKAWIAAGGYAYVHEGGLGQFYKVVRLAKVVLGTQDREAILTALGQVKRLVLACAFATVARILVSTDGNVIFREVLRAAVHVVAVDLIEEFATQDEQESDAMKDQPTPPGLPAHLAKLADKVKDLCRALGSVKEEDARNAVREAIREYEEDERGDEAPGSLGLPSSLSRKDAALLRYMRQAFEKERDFPGSQDLEKKLAWASRMDWKL